MINLSKAMKLYSEEQMKVAYLAGGIASLRQRSGEEYQSFESVMMEIYPEVNLTDGMVKLLSAEVAGSPVPEPVEVR